jgi:hypothetical protein
MSSTSKALVAACGFLMLTGAASIKAAPQGFMEGHLKIVSARAVEASDDMPRLAVAPETYAQYPLVILSQEGEKEITRVTADESGNYRTALPPGSYVLGVQDQATKRLRGKRQPFTIVSNQTVRVDMNIFIGFR